MAKLLAISSGDWHLHIWKNHNPDLARTYSGDNFILHLLERSEEEGIPILFTGDLFQTPKSLTNFHIAHYVEFFIKAQSLYPTAKILGITGNHDESEGCSYVKTFSKIVPGLLNCIDNNRICIGNTMVYGVPYSKNNKDISDYLDKIGKIDKEYQKILMIHTNLYGAQDPNGFEVDEVPNIPRDFGTFFKNVDLVLSGHIHKYAELWDDKVIMVGAPYHQRTSDSGTKMGYIEIYDDLSTKFIPYDGPEFVFYNEGDEVPDDNNWNLIIPKAKVREEGETSIFTNGGDKSNLAKSYCRAKGIKERRRVRLLIETLTEIEE